MSRTAADRIRLIATSPPPWRGTLFAEGRCGNNAPRPDYCIDYQADVEMDVEIVGEGWPAIEPRVPVSKLDRAFRRGPLALVGLALSFQHLCFAFQPDWRYDLWLGLKSLPFAWWGRASSWTAGRPCCRG
jgi:hypothetical protein